MIPAAGDIAINAEILERIRHDFPYFTSHFCKVLDRDGNLVYLHLKPQQMDLWETELKPMLESGRPIRLVILKARQLGFSTMIQAFMLWMALTRPGRGCLVTTHKEDASEALFAKIELMYEELPPAYRRQLEAIQTSGKQGKKLAWGGGKEDPETGKRKGGLNSQIRVDTAGNKTVGRGFTFQIVHASEVAYWEHYKRIFFGLMSALGKRKGTIMIVETTAHGTGTPFHRLWKRAKSRKGLWRAKFYPWHEDAGNVLQIPADANVVWDKEERRLRRVWKLTDEQLYWRRVTIEDEFDGDVLLFQQEHPMSDEEAFIVSGSPYFPGKELERLLDRCTEPLKKGRLELHSGKPMFVQENHTDQYEPPWWVWERPVVGATYLVSGDPAGGTSNDACAAHIIDVARLKVVATMRSAEMDPDDFADQLRWMANSYGTCLVAPEVNGEGRSTIIRLFKVLKYSKLFYHVAAEEWDGGVAGQYGWRTTTKTRPVMLGDLFRLVSKRLIEIPCERTIREMMSFVRKPAKPGRIAEAAEGTHDDMVMSLAIGASNEARTLAMTMQFSEPEAA